MQKQTIEAKPPTTTDSVYEKHKARVRDPQGSYIDQMKAHDQKEIPNDEAVTMNCATFTYLTSILNLIGEVSEIREDRVYQALRMLGYNKCYHEMKMKGDIFSQIGEIVKVCKVSGDTGKMLVAQKKVELFVDVKTKKYRVTKSMYEVAIKQAGKGGINTSHLNLYHVLHGLKVLIENEPDYILMADIPIVKNALERLYDADNNLVCHKAMIEAVAGL